MRSSASQRKRIFSFEEAATLVPEVRRLTDHAVQRLEELGTRFTEDGLLIEDPAAGGGEEPSPEEGTPTGVDTAEVQRVISRWAETVQDLGLEVKGLWLVDFDNGSGYYCWRWPEEGLQYFHTYEEGFRGRMRIH